MLSFQNEQTKTVTILKGALLEDNSLERYLQLKLKNVSKEIINKVSIEIECYNGAGEVVGTKSYAYQNLFVTEGTEFGEQIPIALDSKEIQNVSVVISNVGYFQAVTKAKSGKNENKFKQKAEREICYNETVIEKADFYNKLFVSLARLSAMFCFAFFLIVSLFRWFIRPSFLPYIIILNNISSLTFLYPIGIYLLCKYSNYKKAIILSGLCILWDVIMLIPYTYAVSMSILAEIVELFDGNREVLNFGVFMCVSLLIGFLMILNLNEKKYFLLFGITAVIIGSTIVFIYFVDLGRLSYYVFMIQPIIAVLYAIYGMVQIKKSGFKLVANNN